MSFDRGFFFQIILPTDVRLAVSNTVVFQIIEAMFLKFCAVFSRVRCCHDVIRRVIAEYRYENSSIRRYMTFNNHKITIENSGRKSLRVDIKTRSQTHYRRKSAVVKLSTAILNAAGVMRVTAYISRRSIQIIRVK